MADSDGDIFTLLKQRYPAPKYSFCFEVPDGTSSSKHRTCDALAIGCWQSVGIQVIGHEIKHSRSDWMKELQDPSKSEAWKQYCNLWYVVAPKGIVKLEELPSSWGLMEPVGNAFKIRKAAEIDRSPKPMTLNLVAAITRRFQTGSPSELMLRKEYDRGYREGEENQKRYKTGDQRRAESLEKALKEKTNDIVEFEKQTGIQINGWHGSERAIESFKLFQKLSYSPTEQLSKNARQLADALDRFEASKKEIG